MAILVGMDEAGYGPNLGPLVVAATAWEVADEGSGFGSQIRRGEVQDLEKEGAASTTGKIDRSESSAVAAVLAPVTKRSSADKSLVAGRQRCGEIDLYRKLRPVVARSASERRIAIADSKILYKPGLGLRQLERGVLGTLAAIQRSLTCWSSIVECCDADPEGHVRHVPWHDGFDCETPVDATGEELSRLGVRLARSCEAAGVRPLAIRARLVFPGRFNELVEYYGTKGAALSHVTVGLLREVVDFLGGVASLPAEAGSPMYVVCDKHGGRNYYASLLQHHFSEHWIEPVFESRGESRYEWGPAQSRVRASFRVGGESFLPTALASMTAKYLRELAMRAFNEFWCARVKDLRPTAGYPMDAHRFKAEIEPAQRALGIDDRILWRSR